VPAQSTLPDWTLPGVAHREVDPCVGREPRCAGALRGSQTPVTLFCGHDRLSSRTFWGAGWLQGLGTPLAPPRGSQRLDPDGWLARPCAVAEPIESPAARMTPPGEPYNSSPPSPNARGSVLPKLCPLDKRLLMGGTFIRTCLKRPSRRKTKLLFNNCFRSDPTSRRPPAHAANRVPLTDGKNDSRSNMGNGGCNARCSLQTDI